MDNYVITISRQFASMGRTIAKQMSRELGINFYDRDIVEETAKRLNQPLPEISDREERVESIFYKRQFPLGMGVDNAQKELFYVQSNIIHDFVKKESCIIVGRCADFVLKDHPRCLNIYVYAPYEERLTNCIERLGMDEKTAKNMIRNVDRAREAYRLRYCPDVKTPMDQRHLMIDSSRFGPEMTAKLLCGVARSVFDINND